MKKLILLLCIIGWAGLASAQETYSIALGGTAENTKSAKQTQVGMVNLGRLQWNEDVCKAGSLPATCTQAQACSALNVAGGASCTAAAAMAADARIFPDSQAGREGFIANVMIKKVSPTYLSEQVVRDKAKADAFCASAGAVALESFCSMIGLTQCFACGR
jgi:hypothetical protein